jgi:hypothetical protein
MLNLRQPILRKPIAAPFAADQRVLRPSFYSRVSEIRRMLMQNLSGIGAADWLQPYPRWHELLADARQRARGEARSSSSSKNVLQRAPDNGRLA